MKRLLAVVLLLFTAAVLADNEVAVMENEAGGQIVLTQKACPIPDSADFRLAYTTSTDQRIYGCWKLQRNGRMVHVLWVTPDGESHHRVYDSKKFELLKSI
jgi:hypothetical protein